MREDIAAEGHLTQLRITRSYGQERKLNELQGEDPLIVYACARPLSPQRAPAAFGASGVLPADRCCVHSNRDYRHRRSPHAAGIPRLRQRAVVLPVGPGQNGSKGRRHCGIHRPRAGIRGLPGRLGCDEMYRQSLLLVRSAMNGRTRQDLERFDTEVWTGGASTDLRDIVRAEHLILRESGRVAAAIQDGADLLDTAAVQTLRHGGDVRTLPETSMPSGGSIYAIFRYASAGSE